MTKHKHADAIIAWANGAEIEYQIEDGGSWYEDPTPRFSTIFNYRIKAKPDVIRYVWATEKMGEGDVCFTEANGPNLKLVFDSETRKLKDAKLI